MNDSLKLGYFGKDLQLHLLTEVTYIFFAFLVNQYIVVLTWLLMIWPKYATIVYDNELTASIPSTVASHYPGVA